MKARNLLVTGGCGFIGSNFILGQFGNGHCARLVNLDALTYAANPRNLESLADNERYHFQHGRIGDNSLVAELLERFEIEAVVNFAAESHVDRSIDHPMVFMETNVLETTRLLQAALAYFRSLSDERRQSFRFLHVSTDEVFGSLEPGAEPFSETSPFAPNSPYAASKAASDHVVRSYFKTYGLPVLATNCCNNFGPFQYPEKLIPLMISRALEGEILPVYGDGSNIRDWLHVHDSVEAIAFVLDGGRPGETYCIGGVEEHDNLTLVQTLCTILDRLRPRRDGSYQDLIRFVPDRPGHDFRYAIDASKMKGELGWQPRVAFSDGLEKTVRWYLEHPGWFQGLRSDPPP